ncbi:MAG: antitoxin [Luteolibacter sp.]
MTKTQIQVPEELFEELRTFAKHREWSLAETFRRGAELLLQVYPETADKAPTIWTPPTSNQVGWKGLSAEELREAAFADGDPHLS